MVERAAYSDALDGLRGIAALMVVASHASAGGLRLVPGVSLEGIGKHGVFLFFVISAYLLTAQALNWMEQPHRWRSTGTFFWRRMVRIFPLYAVVLTAAWALGGSGLGVSMNGKDWVRHLALLEGKGIYWSIPVEFGYYLCIPALVWLTKWVEDPRWGAGLIVVLMVGIGWLFPASQAPANSDQLGWYLPVFLAGSLAAWCVRQGWRLPLQRVGSGAWRGALLLGLGLALTPPAWQLLWPNAGVDALHRAFLFWGLLWAAILVWAQAGAWGWMQRVLQARPMCACGRWCFGLYLLHLPALAVARRLPGPEWFQAWAGLGLSVTVAALAYRFIERPSQRWAYGQSRGSVRARA